MPGKQYTPPGDRNRRTEVTSPPFVAGANPEETERIRQLLFKKFDMTPSGAEPDSEPEKRSENVSPAVVPATAHDDTGIDAPSYSAMALEDAVQAKKMDSTQKMALIGILGLVVLFGLVVSASMKNSARYYLKPVKGELEIWKGRFSPMGKKKFVILSETPMPVEPKEVYGKNEIFPFIFESYVNQADALLNASDMPDFELIKSTLSKANAFVVSPESKELIQRRLSKINLMTLVYKADILTDRGTIEDLASARDALKKAKRLNLDEAEKGLVNQKLQWIDERQAQLEQMETEVEDAELKETEPAESALEETSSKDIDE